MGNIEKAFPNYHETSLCHTLGIEDLQYKGCSFQLKGVISALKELKGAINDGVAICEAESLIGTVTSLHFIVALCVVRCTFSSKQSK